MREGQTFWSRRPSPSRALSTLVILALVGLLLALAAEHLTTKSVRARLPLGDSRHLEEFFLTQLGEDPARVLLTSRFENSTWTRDVNSMAGDPYWIRRYSDPARPGLPARILLTSRSRGAHLFVPVGALDLERALAERSDELPPAAGQPAPPAVRSELSLVYLDRAFAGAYLHLRFPKRPLTSEDPTAADTIEYDLVVVRGNRLRTTDFLLQPNASLYRDALADGRMPAGEFRRNPDPGDELVLLVWGEPRAGAAEPLYLPLSLFDELGLCWGEQLGTVVDDRWRVEALPAFALRPATADVRARAAWGGALHLAARFESPAERENLERALSGLGGG